MKTSILLFVALLFLSSITYRVRPKDCGCSVESKYYYKGKLVKRFVTTKGFYQTPTVVDNSIDGKSIKYDSLSVTPTN